MFREGLREPVDRKHELVTPLPRREALVREHAPQSAVSSRKSVTRRLRATPFFRVPLPSLTVSYRPLPSLTVSRPGTVSHTTVHKARAAPAAPRVCLPPPHARGRAPPAGRRGAPWTADAR